CSARIDSDPLNVAALSGSERIVTKTRTDVLSPASWARTETRNDVHRPSRIDDSLMSIERFTGMRARALVFKRAWGDAPYGPEDREIVHLAHAECAWVFESAAVATAPAGDWSPRERETLEILLTGASEKSAAARLGLSRHTVHDYVKAIYKRLGVASRAELMALAVSRSGMHRLPRR
ncbi:MAG TPA: LuxR C-terminal-related transcriptional regulator, partial [Polyangiaceae bacterium]